MSRIRWYWPLGFLVAAVALILAVTPAASTPPIQPKESMILPWKGMHVGMDILINGQAAPTVNWKGKMYLPVSQWDASYQIRVWNNGMKRITAIVSVDGVSVITLQPASEKQPGYLVSPHGNIVIKGWRKNDQTVAAFTFADRDQSYAAKIGHPENVGVIGLVAFEELTYPPVVPLIEQKNKLAAPADAGGFKAIPAPGAVGSIGTGYGKTVYSPTYEVPFVRSTHKHTMTIYYDTVDALREMGVPVEPYYPNPFPGNPKLTPAGKG